ncbi:MAG TPA: acyl carrier protein [Gammaproteobacteria bacterium]|jgi:acyl carrier protein
MSEVRGELRECFQAAFPAVPLSSLETLAPERDAVWDSLATLTLVMLVEERFGVRIPTDEIPRLLSFDAMADYLETRQ